MSYERMVRERRWPPTSRETAMFVIGVAVGALVMGALMVVVR